MVRSSVRVLACLLSLIVALTSLPGPSSLAGETTPGLLVYHQITNIDPVSQSVGSPMLSGDGSTAVFADAPGTGEVETPNRIFTVGFDGTGLVVRPRM
jgi:hypothetical protein